MTNALRIIVTVALLALLFVVASCGPNEEAAPATPTAAPVADQPAQADTEQTQASETADATADAGAQDAATEGAEPASASAASPSGEENTIITATGLQYTEIAAGTGKRAQPGNVVAVHYTGRLADGTEFDSSLGRGEPFRFALGTGSVIPGWDEGIALMAEGGKATLVIPPELAYGSSGAGGGVIPPDATLTFDVELVEVAEGAPDAPAEVAEADYVTTEEGLKYYDFVVGDGASPQPGQRIAVHYTGWLQDGTMFDSSLNRGAPIRFNVGAGQVIAGWDIGLRDMQVGGKRQLVIPPELAYGADGAGGVIPPDATLVFEVELVAVE